MTISMLENENNAPTTSGETVHERILSFDWQTHWENKEITSIYSIKTEMIKVFILGNFNTTTLNRLPRIYLCS